MFCNVTIFFCIHVCSIIRYARKTFSLQIYIHYHEVTPVRKYHEYNPITEEDIAILAAEEPKAPILSNWWVLVWDSQLTCNEIAAALSSRWSILIASNNKIPKYRYLKYLNNVYKNFYRYV